MAAPKMEKTRYPGVYKRGSRYVATFRANGKQHKQFCRTLAEARRVKSARQTEVASGEYHEDQRVTFVAYAREWVKRYEGTSKGFRESTREDYERDLKHAYEFFGERKRITHITPRDMARYAAHLRTDKHGRRRADSTIRRIVAPARSCLSTAVREGLVRFNPARDMALPNRPKVEDGESEEVRALTREQLATFLQVTPQRHRLLFKFLASTGLRISEAIAVEWRDLKLDGSTPHVEVRRQYYRKRLTPPKSKYGRRKVPLDASLVFELRRHRKETEWPEDNNLAFPSATGTYFDQHSFRRRVLKPAAEEAGVPWMGFHTLRHTFASLLFERGANAKQAQRLLGHHSPAFTLNAYVHLLGDDLGEPLALDAELAGNTRATQADETGLDANAEPGGNDAQGAGFAIPAMAG